MLFPYWLNDVLRKELDDEIDSDGGGTAVAEAPAEPAKPKDAYDFADKGLAVEMDSGVKTPEPSETSDDETTSGSDAPDETDSEKETSAVDESAEPATDADDSDDLSERSDLIDRVAALGLDYSDIKQFRKASTLSAYLDQAERLQARLATTRKAKDEPKPEAPLEPKKPDFTARLTAQREKIAKMLADGFDEETISLQRDNLELLETLAESQKQQDARYDELQKISKQQQDAAAAQQYAETVASFEKSITELGDEYKVLFGTGKGKDLKPAEKANRDRLWDAMDEIATVYNNRGKAVPNMAELSRRAVAMEFSEHTQQLARQKLKGDLKKAGSQTITRARPVGHTAARGMEAALARFDEQWQP